ncbi:MAG: hypothetical protein ACRDTQ_04910 [Micromonosporaceae bacterium]
MSHLIDVSNTLAEVQIALGAAWERSQLAVTQAQLAHQAAQQLGAAGLVTNAEELQRELLVVQQKISEADQSAAIAVNSASELAAGAPA